MKLTTLLMTVLTVNIMASVYSQNTRFNLEIKDQTVRDVLKTIENRSQFRFFYNDEFTDLGKKVTFNANDQSIDELLYIMLNNTDVTYRIMENNFVVLTPKSLMQQQTVSGMVKDGTTGEPLAGVTIQVQGTMTGAISQADGSYRVNIPEGANTLIFSFVGYITQEIPVNKRSVIDVVMEEEITALEEVVVIGYGVQKKSVITGAISGTNAREIENQPIYRVDQALQGRVSGVTFASKSGQPGASSTVRVRGTTSINNSEPLYVVDGIPLTGNIDYLNQNDIESIEILKDAASAAIYGARAAAGVILVTTKSGNIGETRISYNGYYGLQGPARKLDLLNATEYATLYNEMLENSGKTPVFTNPESLGEGTDWQEEVFSYNSVIQNHDINISGGNDRITYYTSFGYTGLDGIILPEISYYKRYNIRVNTDYKLKEWIRFGENIGYSNWKQVGIADNANVGGVLTMVTHLDPITPVYETDPLKLNSPPYSSGLIPSDENGNFYSIPYYSTGQTNPFILAKYRDSHPVSHNVIGNFYVELNPIKNLIIKSTVGVGGILSESETYQAPVYLNPAFIIPKNSYIVSYGSNYFWNLENTVSYSFNINNHNFVALAGMGNYVDNISKLIGVSYQDIPVDNYDDASLNWSVLQSDKRASGFAGNIHKLSSLYGRLIYNFDEKYLFTGIIRRDGSSRFGTNNKFGVFPSASVGWVISQEGFWIQNNIIDFLKVRASYGETGSDNMGDFRYVSVIQGNRNYTIGNELFIGYTPESIANPDLKWESTSQLNIGFDAAFLRNFRLTFDWFDKRTRDMLLTVQIPSYAGAGNPTGNVASMKNTGIEAELSYRKALGNLTIDLKGNASYIKNEVTDIGDNEFIKGGLPVHMTDYEITRIMVGLPFNSFYGFEADGIFQNEDEVSSYVNEEEEMLLPDARPGDFKWKDLNGDGSITDADRKYLGNSLPDWTYGINIAVSWKNWDLNIFGQGVQGNLIFDHIRYGENPADNWTSRVMDRWHGEGTSNTVPILLEEDKNENFLKPSRFQLFSGSFFRLKSLQVGYSLPQSIISRIRMKNCRLYGSVSNLFTITKYPGYDPEIGSQFTIYGQEVAMGIDQGVYPQARAYMMGLNITF